MGRNAPRPTFLGLAALVAALGLALACGSKQAWQLGLPGVDTPFQVVRSTLRGEYLDVTLSGGGFTLRSFAPASETCREVLEPEARVEWLESGTTGAFRRDGVECNAVGLGSLHEWRERGPRPEAVRGESPVPRRQASYRTFYEDDEVVMLRGDFPVANLLGWSSFGDTIAVLPRTAECDGPASRSTSSMEYRAEGQPALALVGESGLCPIVGLVRPPPHGTPREDAGEASGE